MFRRALIVGQEAITDLQAFRQGKSSDKPSSVCYLQFSHGQFIDSMKNLLNDEGRFLRNEDPEGLVDLLQSTKYSYPAYCGISGFTLEFDAENKIKTLRGVLKNYKEHM